MAADGDSNYYGKQKQPHCKKCHCHPKQQLKALIWDSGQGLCNSNSMYKVDLNNI